MDAESAQAMIEALRSATAAAEAASRTAARTNQEAKLLKTPSALVWDEKSKHADWVEWNFVFMSWIATQDPVMGNRLKTIEARRNVELPYDQLEAEDKERTVRLYNILGALVQGKLLRIVMLTQI